MQVQFKNALFDASLFSFAVVQGTSLLIVTEVAEIELDFGTTAEALEAQVELGDLLNSVKGTNDFSDTVEGAVSAVSSLFSGLFNKGKTKATNATSSVDAVFSDLLSSLEAALNPAGAEKASPAPTAAPTARSSAAEANDVFGTNRTARTDAADTVIGDLTDAALRTAINDKADSLIANDARVQALVEELRRFYNEADVQEVIATRKDQVFRLAKANPTLTVNQVFAQLLR